MMSKISILTLCVAFTSMLALSHGQPFGLGSCAAVEPMADFNMTAFLGDWYVVQKTLAPMSRTNIRCLTTRISPDSENPGQFVVEEMRRARRTVMGTSFMKVAVSRDGKLKPRDGATTAAEMTIQFPLNTVTGAAQYSVFITDYDTFAGVFICHKLAFANRQSAMILSRTPTLDKIYVNKVRNRLNRFGAGQVALRAINQTDCPEPITKRHRFNTRRAGKVNVTIDDDGFLGGLVSGAVRKAGEKIGDRLETVAKKIYHGVMGDAGDSATKSSEKGDKLCKDDLRKDDHIEHIPVVIIDSKVQDEDPEKGRRRLDSFKKTDLESPNSVTAASDEGEKAENNKKSETAQNDVPTVVISE